LLGAWRNRVGAHDPHLIIWRTLTDKSFSRRYSVYNTVVLGRGADIEFDLKLIFDFNSPACNADWRDPEIPLL